MTTAEVEDKLAHARILLLMTHPFLGVLAFYLQIKDMSESVPTMGTDGKHLFYNKDFVCNLPPLELQGVLAHELMHCVYQHTSEWRSNGKVRELWNLAIEFPTNEAVIEMFKLPLPGYKQDARDNKIFINKDFYNMTSDEIYEKLLKMAKKELEKLKKYGEGNKLKVFIDEHGIKMPGECGCEGDEPSEKDGATESLSGSIQDKKLEHEWKMRIVQAAEAQKKKGPLPAGLERIIGDLIDPKVPWRQVLAEYLTSLSYSDYSWKIPNRRHIYRNVILPGLRSEEIEIAVAFDTSGSISQEELSEYASELKGIMSCYPNYKLYLMGCDAEIYGYQEVGPHDNIDFSGMFKGHGGTDFRPVFKEIKDKNIRPACLIYFTDTYGSFPDKEPEYPVLWVVKTQYCSGGNKIPFGRVIEL